MGRDVPRLVPGRVPMPAKVGGDDVEPIGQPLLGQLPEAQAMAGDAMEADDACAFVAPLVRVQPHEPSSGS